MKTLIVYDSFFGNTEKIAQAIGQALGSPPDVQVVRVSVCIPEQLSDLQWLIVGSPTRGFQPSPLIKNFLATIPAGALRGVKVTAFDTRSPLEKFPGFLRFLQKRAGWADKHIVAALTKKGGELAAPPEGFFVQDSEGPLVEGELERAGEWARRLQAVSEQAFAPGGMEMKSCKS
jgi:flavodoxin